MNFKIELKQNLETRICNGKQPTINSEIIKSKLTFNTEELPAKQTSNKSFKFIFAKSAYFMVSLVAGMCIGGGIIYGIKAPDSYVIDPNGNKEGFIGLKAKVNIVYDVQLNIIPKCASFTSEITLKNLLDSKIINENNIKTMENITITNDEAVVYTPIEKNVSFACASMALYEKDKQEYIYLLTKNERYERYRLESNLPYTSNELITSFEDKIGQTLTTEFLNDKDSGIFSLLKYDTYANRYYLSHELNYEEITYIANYDYNLEKIVVKTLM